MGPPSVTTVHSKGIATNVVGADGSGDLRTQGGGGMANVCPDHIDVVASSEGNGAREGAIAAIP